MGSAFLKSGMEVRSEWKAYPHFRCCSSSETGVTGSGGQLQPKVRFGNTDNVHCLLGPSDSSFICRKAGPKY